MPEYLVTVGVRAGDARPVIVSILHNESYTAQARRYPLALPAWRGRHLGSIVDPARTTVTEPRPNTLTCRFSAHGGANLRTNPGHRARRCSAPVDSEDRVWHEGGAGSRPVIRTSGLVVTAPALS